MALPSWFKVSEGLQARVITAAILAPIVLAIVAVGGWIYHALVILAVVLMTNEWNGIISSEASAEKTDKQLKRWRIGGIIYATVFGTSLMYLRSMEGGFSMVLYLLFVIWSMDIGAYFSGRFIGGPKVAPSISPKKTWAGVIGGAIACGFVGVLFSIFMHEVGTIEMVLISVLLGIISQAGDFLESWLKRQFGVKDSGTLLPGHGGLMDRVDSLVTGAPFLVVVALAHGQGFF